MRAKSRVELLKGDITQVSVDAIVNAANTSLLGGGGVDGAIHRAGGPAILDECRKIVARQGGCAVGQAVITGAGNLKAKFVIHTVGPRWNGGKNNESEKLGSCYRNSLQLAVDHQCRTIAFPCISTGIYGYPIPGAAKIAVDTVKEFLSHSDAIDNVILVCFDDTNWQFLKGQLNYKVYTIPAKLFAGNNLLGTINIGLGDDGMGVLSGVLTPTEEYEKHRAFLQDTFAGNHNDSLIRINQYTQANNFTIVADDGTRFGQPVAGLIVYDLADEPVVVELAGVDSKIWTKYFL